MMRRALVIGGSIGGLFTALLLRQRGWDVMVTERVATPLSGRGAGIVTHPQLWRIMERLGFDPTAAFGVPVERRVTYARDGSVSGVLAVPQVMTAWDRLFRMLRDAWPDDRYVDGAELRTIEAVEGGVRAHFADGAVREAALLVGADGVRSTTRTLSQGDVPAQYAGYAAWRGLVPEAAVSPALFPDFAFCLPPGEQILGYPVAGEGDDLRPGHRRYNVVWYRPADPAALQAMLTDATGRVHAHSIPPPLIRPAIVAEMRDAAARVLAPDFATVMVGSVQPFLQPIYDLAAPRMAVGRVVLVGDSAFVARPHVGAGVTKAAEDAWALAEALEHAPIEAALLAYEAARQPAGRRIMQRARHLGSYLQAQRDTEEDAAAARHQSPAAVMAETALLDF